MTIETTPSRTVYQMAEVTKYGRTDHANVCRRRKQSGKKKKSAGRNQRSLKYCGSTPAQFSVTYAALALSLFIFIRAATTFEEQLA